jgi:1-phosphatidylinositol-3-phosphate 5-kinase
MQVFLPNPMDSANKVNKKPGVAVHDILSLNWLYQTLLLETYVCDCYLNHLFCSLNLKQEKHPTCTIKSGEKSEESLGTLENLCQANTSHKGSEEPLYSSEIIPVIEESSLEMTLSDSKEKTEPDGLDPSLSLDVTQQDKDAQIWTSFSNLLMSYRKELQDGTLSTFNLINRYKPRHLPQIQNQQQDSEPQRQFYVGPDGNILSVSEDEISSLIAYSLCLSDEEKRKNKMEPDAQELDSSVLLNRMSSLTPEEFLSASKHLHTEYTIIKDDTLSLKGKYIITSVYAEQFYDLRKKCFLSEIMYIGSLSRCKRWNAQGGKTKAFFSKTMDDRFIIKGIKKIEFDSFLQFAPHYFNYMSESVEKGNQTCLAKILGIYQVSFYVFCEGAM